MNRRDFLLGATALATTAVVPVPYGAAGSFMLAEFERRYAMPAMAIANGGTSVTPAWAFIHHGYGYSVADALKGIIPHENEALRQSIIEEGGDPDVDPISVFHGEMGSWGGVKFVEP